MATRGTAKSKKMLAKEMQVKFKSVLMLFAFCIYVINTGLSYRDFHLKYGNLYQVVYDHQQKKLLSFLRMIEVNRVNR